MHKLSIIIPAYNAEPYIEHLINRLKPQVRDDVEVLVVDDGSIDNTESLFSNWVKEDNQFNIRYYKKISTQRYYC